jgi:hypothetical protein
MLAAYGVDVLDPRTSARRVHVLLERLPPSYRLPGEQWSVEAELLAGLIDHVANLCYITARAAGARSATRPQPVKRPPRRHRPAQQQQRAQVVAGAPNGKARNWAEAAGMIATVPGVVVRRDDRLRRA